MSARWWTLGVWALAAASAAYWGLRLFSTAAPVPAHARPAEAHAATRGDLSRLFGVDAPMPVAASTEPAPDARFQLIGVLSPRSPQAAREGVALIAVDGKPPRAFRVGSVVDGQNVLKTVNARGATLGPREGAALVALNLAPPPVAATGSLPALPGAAPLPPPALPYPGAGPAARPSAGAINQRRGPAGAQAQEMADPQQQPISNPGQDQTLTR
jgi:general secretion pathway protein C